MKPKRSVWTTRKYMGDDIYSHAVFKDGNPVLTGQSISEARYERNRLSKKDREAYDEKWGVKK